MGDDLIANHIILDYTGFDQLRLMLTGNLVTVLFYRV
jgi:hypothetical protein